MPSIAKDISSNQFYCSSVSVRLLKFFEGSSLGFLIWVLLGSLVFLEFLRVSKVLLGSIEFLEFFRGSFEHFRVILNFLELISVP